MITRLNTFVANEGKEEELKVFLGRIQDFIQSSEGNLSVELLQSDSDPKELVVHEKWDSKESHKASLKNFPQEDIHKIFPLLATPPKASYYQ